MKSQYKLTLQEARNLQLALLGLLNPPVKTATKNGVLGAIKNLSVLQIDTIHVVNRSPYLVLYSRLGAFNMEWLEGLLGERKLFEYWAHEACFLPIEDYPLYNAMIHSKKARAFNWSKEWITANRKDALRVLTHVQRNGPTMSSHFTAIKRKEDGLPAEAGGGGWWNWKTEKMALDMLYTQGKLTIIGRKSFQRIYDTTARGIPEEYLLKKIMLSDVYKEFIERSVKHLGITKKSWVHDYFRLKKTVAYPVFEKLLRKKKFIEVQVEGFNEPLYVHKDNLHLLEQAVNGMLYVSSHVTFLSPFDPLVWDRKRAKELFGFEYQIESYTPMDKRKYGYFTLPILYRGQLIGRMDAKAHRADKMFEVKALYFEEGYKPDKKCLVEIAKKLKEFAMWHGTSTVSITYVNVQSCKETLIHLLR